MKIASLLTALKPFKAFTGKNNIDRVVILLEAELDRVCGKLMEGQDEKDAA